MGPVAKAGQTAPRVDGSRSSEGPWKRRQRVDLAGRSVVRPRVDKPRLHLAPAPKIAFLRVPDQA